MISKTLLKRNSGGYQHNNNHKDGKHKRHQGYAIKADKSATHNTGVSYILLYFFHLLNPYTMCINSAHLIW